MANTKTMSTEKTTSGKISTTLYFKSGSSDKVYTAWIEESKGGCLVNFAFGRRGNTLQTGSKTPEPVSKDKALKIWQKLLDSKMAKGYAEGEDSTPYTATSKEKLVTGIVPQLLNPVTRDDALGMIKDKAFCAQEKFDGRRMMIQVVDDEAKSINRQGLICGAPAGILEAALALSDGKRMLIDGEAVGEVLHVFDLLELGDQDLRGWGYNERLQELGQIFIGFMDARVVQVPTARTCKEKEELLKVLEGRGAEGIVFKHAKAKFTPGRPASGGDQLKFKFVETASAIVTGVNQGKRSVSLGFVDSESVVDSGSVTIPANHQVPPVDAVVEVRYLYAMPGSNALYQPVYLGERNDIPPTDCTLDQLKWKNGEKV